MNLKFQKQYTIREMVRFVLERWRIILTVIVLSGVLAGIVGSMKNAEEEISRDITSGRQYVLIDNNYVYSSLVMITPIESNIREIDSLTFLRLYISEEVINETIDDLHLSESYIDIFNKFNYMAEGNTVLLGIKSPVSEVDGHSWEEILDVILEKGKEKVNMYFPDYQVEIVDAPYIMNKELDIEASDIEASDVEVSDVESKVAILKKVILFMLCMFIGVCAILSCIYLLNDKIYSVEDIEENLELPVLAEMKVGVKNE